MLQTTYSTNKIYNINEHPRSKNILLPNRQAQNQGYLNPGGSQSLPRNGSPRITSNYQSSQTIVLPKFQLTYHVQPHLQQFQQKILIPNLNSSSNSSNSMTYSNNPGQSMNKINRFDSNQKQNYLLPINRPKNVSKFSIIITIKLLNLSVPNLQIC